MLEPLFHKGDEVVFIGLVLYNHAHGDIDLDDDQEEAMKSCVFRIETQEFDDKRNLWGYQLKAIKVDDAYAEAINLLIGYFNYYWDERELALCSGDLDDNPELTDVTFLIGGADGFYDLFR